MAFRGHFRRALTRDDALNKMVSVIRVISFAYQLSVV
jgi:hypothetical protein